MKRIKMLSIVLPSFLVIFMGQFAMIAFFSLPGKMSDPPVTFEIPIKSLKGRSNARKNVFCFQFYCSGLIELPF